MAGREAIGWLRIGPGMTWGLASIGVMEEGQTVFRA